MHSHSPRVALTSLISLLALAAAACVEPSGPEGEDGEDLSGVAQEAGTFPSVSDFAASGPFSTTSGSLGLSCTVYRPSTLGQNGVTHPVILWGNGTGASPSTTPACSATSPATASSWPPPTPPMPATAPRCSAASAA